MISVIAAVRVVLPWSTCPIVPTFTCGFVRSNFAFAMHPSSSDGLFLDAVSLDALSLRLRQFGVVAELHRINGPALAHGPQRGRVAEHLGQRHARRHDLRVGTL